MIWLVSGFMRSGTSMMMSCLEAGGMSAVKSEAREQFGQVHSDEQYKVNAGGLYEPDPREFQQPGWPKQHDGKALKVVVPWLHFLAVHEYHVLFMRRNAEEIRQSYEAAFGASCYGGSAKPVPKDGSVLQSRIENALEQLRNRKDVKTLVQLHYADVVKDARGAFQFLKDAGWLIDVEAAAAKVNPDLYRFRLERLTPGL